MKFILLSLFLVIALAPIVNADIFTVRSGSDDLEINESFGNVIDALDGTHLPALKSGIVKTSKADTTYKQYLRFKNAALAIESPRVVYGENDRGTFGNYLFVKEGTNVTDAAFEYEIDFEEGLVSDIKGGKLETLNRNQIVLFGEAYYFLDSSLDLSKNTLTLKLAAADHVVTVNEGEKQTYTIGGKPYEIEAVSIQEAATIKINNRTVPNLRVGETKDLDTKMLFAAMQIFKSSEAKDAVTLLLNATVLTLKDTDYTDENFIQGFSVNNRIISSGWTKIKATSTANEAKIIKILYRMVAAGKHSGDLYIPQGEKLRGNLEQPEAMFSSLWDMHYRGLASIEKTNIKISPATSKGYNLVFYNKQGKLYKMPLVYNSDAYRIGDETRTLYFIEATGNTNFLVDHGDYFVLTSSNDKTGTTNIIKYNSINTDTKELEFEDISTGKFKVSYSPPSSGNFSGEGSIVSAGKAYRFYIENTTTGANTSTLAIDLNGDNAIETDEVNIIAKGGAVIDLGSTNTPTAGFTVTLTTEASQFDEAASAETINIPVTKETPNGVGIGNITGMPVETKGKKTEGGSNYGIYLSMLEQDTENLEIQYPLSQVFGQVDITTTGKTIVLASCSDGLMNQGEQGVDCGGPCSTACIVQNITSNVTENTTIVPENVSACEGCSYEGTCYSVGKQISNLYCASDGVLNLLKDNGQPCLYSYQCKENICKENICRAAKESVNVGLVLLNIAVIMAAAVFLFLTWHMQKKKPLKF